MIESIRRFNMKVVKHWPRNACSLKKTRKKWKSCTGQFQSECLVGINGRQKLFFKRLEGNKHHVR